jgi:UPF0755 protein
MSRNQPKNKWIKGGVIAGLIALVIIAGSVYGARRYYQQNLQAVSANQTAKTVNIPTGSSVADVATILKEKQLIRNEWAFTQYIRNNGLQDKILAGTYAIAPSQSVSEIVEIITKGKISSKLITIKPGQRIDQLKQSFINAGFSEESVQDAFNPTSYVGHPALVDKPTAASLEGYLYPESFQKTDETTPRQIVTQSLDEMQKRLTPELREAFSRQGLSTHRAVILASMVEREVDSVEDRRQVAQVFLKRLAMNKRLESDATASYGAILNGEEPSLTYQSPYNTYYNDGLPAGPISNVTESSLQAVANPAGTDWVFFVSGDDGITYFSRTLEEHEALTAQHCKKLCGQ